MQPYLFPYIGYFQGIHAVDKYILYDNLAYIKEGWVNKNRFLVVKGEPAFFNAEVKKRSSFKKISDMELVEDGRWRKKILKSFFFNYGGRPFFDEIYDLVEQVINAEVHFLTDLNSKSIIEVCDYLEIETQITKDTNKYHQIEDKLSNDELDISVRFPSINLTKPEKKVIRVLEICRMEGANTFINAFGGQDLYDKDEFKKNNVELFFVQTNKHSYQQSTEIFYPHLSIIDVLMNCGKERTKTLLREYILI